MSVVLVVIGVLATGLALASPHHGPGTLDRSFAGHGSKLINLKPSCKVNNLPCDDYGEALAIDSKGRIVISGISGFTSEGRTGIVRLQSNGRLDRGFGGDGRVRVPGAYSGSQVAIDSHDRILVETGLEGITRLSTNGTIDRAFGENGHIEDDDPFAIDGADRIIVAGNSRTPSQGHGIRLRRYLPNGQLDPSFDGGAVPPRLGYRSIPTKIAIDDRNRFVVAGESSNLDVDSYAGLLARFDPDGSVDRSFGAKGTIGFDNPPSALALDSHERIVIGHGSFGDGGSIARYSPGGMLDRRFSGDGRRQTGTKHHGFEVYAVAVDRQNRVIAVGGNSNGGTVARYKSTGKLDDSFSDDGKVNAASTNPMAITLDPKQRIVIAGNHFPPDSGSDFAVARYLGR